VVGAASVVGLSVALSMEVGESVGLGVALAALGLSVDVVAGVDVVGVSMLVSIELDVPVAELVSAVEDSVGDVDVSVDADVDDASVADDDVVGLVPVFIVAAALSDAD